MQHVLTVGAVVSTIGIVLAQAVPDLSGWGPTAILGLITLALIWLHGQRIDKLADAIRDLVKELSQRPCVRDPEND